MASKKINELTTISGVSSGDMLVVYDVSDITTEKTKSILYSDFESGLSVSSNRIEQGNSFVDVTDAGTGEISISADSTEVMNIKSSTMILGVNGDTNVQLNQSSGQVAVLSDNLTVANFNPTIQRLGITNDTVIEVNQASDYINMKANNVQMFNLTSTSAQLGLSGDSRFIADVGGNTASIYAGSYEVVDLAPTFQTFGVAGDTYLTLNQNDNLIEFTGTLSGTGDIYCDDLYTSGTTIHVGDGEIKSSLGNIELYYGGNNVFRTQSNGILIQDSNNTGVTMSYAGADTFTIHNTENSGEIILRGKNSGGVDHDMVNADPSGPIELYYNGVKTVTVGNNLVDLHRDGSDGSRLYNDGSDLFLQNKIDGGGVLLTAENNSAEQKNILWGDPDSNTALYHTGLSAISTAAYGADIRDTSGSSTQLQLKSSGGTSLAMFYTTSTDTYLRGMQHGGNLLLQQEDNGGNVETLLDGDPDGAVKLFYNGVNTESFRTQRDGIVVVDSNGSAPYISLVTFDGNARATLYNNNSNNYFRGDVNGHDTYLTAKNSSGNTRYVGIDVSATAFVPYPTDTIDLGVPESAEWDDIYHNGSINPSDKRKKTTISGSDLGLDFVNDLNPVSYMYKDYDYVDEQPDGTIISGTRTYHRRHYGLIAQEVEATLSGIAKDTEDFAGFVYNEDSDYYGLRYAEFIAPMMKAIQQLSDKIDNLTTRIEALET